MSSESGNSDSDNNDNSTFDLNFLFKIGTDTYDETSCGLQADKSVNDIDLNVYANVGIVNTSFTSKQKQLDKHKRKM